MANQPTDAQNQWIKDVSGGTFDPAAFQPTQGDDSATAGGSAIAAKKAKLAGLAKTWADAEDTLREDIEAVHSALVEHFDGDEHAHLMEKDFAEHTNTVFSTFDGTLAQQIKSAAAAKTEPELDAIVAEVRAVVSKYRSAADAHATIKLLDENPFIHLGMSQYLSSTLDTLMATLS